LAVEHGYRESSENWAAMMRDLTTRGLNEPKLVIGDGALGTSRAALRCPRTARRSGDRWSFAVADSGGPSSYAVGMDLALSVRRCVDDAERDVHARRRHLLADDDGRT
jgi:hypothetical protein